MLLTACWTLGEVQMIASHGWVGPIRLMAITWRMAAGAIVWTRPSRL
jgi:hypothetical protein